jgi:hypothetical protein
MLGIGVTMGLLVGLGMMIGVMVSDRIREPHPFEFPDRLLHASATHGASTMALATGPIDDGVEGLFVLDFITGELQCSVLNRNGQLGGLYRHNVVGDLGVQQGKQPKYLMVTGQANFRYSGGSIRPAESVVYVADANTGSFAAYMLPWNRTASQYNSAQSNRMILLGKGAARRIEVE